VDLPGFQGVVRVRLNVSKVKAITAVLTVTYTALFIPIIASGQPSPFAERNLSGNLVDQDYFTASLNAETKYTLFLVERAHASERTWKLFFAGKYYEGPIADCEYALRYFPNHPGVLHMMGEISRATNQDSMAIGCFERALKLYPQHALTHAQYGHYLFEIGAANAGIAELLEALQLDPDQLQARAWLDEALPPGTRKGQPPPRDVAKSDSSGSRSGPPRGGWGN
jgi:tetratricopeptide (TPR) repeat protein